MKKLNNTEEDRNFLHKELSKGSPLKATFSISRFTPKWSIDLNIANLNGIVTGINLGSGYCTWKHENGQPMPVVNISCITLK